MHPASDVRPSHPLQPGEALWGARRARAGVSIRVLADRSGVSRGQLSLMEAGRLMPTAAQFDVIMAALEGLERGLPPVLVDLRDG